MALKMHPSLRIPAGVWLKEELVEPHGINVKQLAAHFRVSRQALSNVLHGHSAFSADMAIRFEKAFGVKADTLMRMQAAYELAQAREHEKDIVVGKLAAA